MSPVVVQEADVLAYMSFPAQHRAKLHATHPAAVNSRDSNA